MNFSFRESIEGKFFVKINLQSNLSIADTGKREKRGHYRQFGNIKKALISDIHAYLTTSKTKKRTLLFKSLLIYGFHMLIHFAYDFFE